MKTFIGAEMKEGKVLNENASRLEKYYNAVINEDSSAGENILEFIEFEDLQELRAAGVFVNFDMVLLLLGQESQDTCLEIIDHVLKSEIRNKMAIIVFPSTDRLSVGGFELQKHSQKSSPKYDSRFSVSLD